MVPTSYPEGRDQGCDPRGRDDHIADSFSVQADDTMTALNPLPGGEQG